MLFRPRATAEPTVRQLMKWPKYVLIAIALLIALAIALPQFISLDDYRPRIEQEASTRIKQPVTITSIKFAALPLPHVTVSGITVGKDGDFAVGSVKLIPDLLSLLQTTRTIKSVEIDSVVMTQKGLDAILALLRADAFHSLPTPAVRVASIHLENVVARLGTTDFGPCDARVEMDGQGKPADASVTTRDGKLKILLKPDQANYLIDVSARAWALPAGPPLLFEELSIRGVATQDDVRLDVIEARLYGGTAAGKMHLNWEKGLRIDGNLDLDNVELQQLAPLLSPGSRISGKLSAKPVFTAAADSADHVANTLRLETGFRIRNGTLHGIDIQLAATRLIKRGTSGGETRFEHMSGHLLVTQGSQHFTQLRIASGALSASGRVSVTPKKALSGRIVAQIAAAGAHTGVPLNVGGTVGAPTLHPTGGTIAGAALGTVILGPGFGTSVGAKVGGWADGLFEANPPTTPAR